MNTQLLRLMRQRAALSSLYARQTSAVQMASISPIRGGGGHWHKPDPKPYTPYKHTRRIRLEDVNTDLYNSNAPEYYLHMHSPHIQSSKQGVLLWFSYFFLIIFPAWLFTRYLSQMSTANCFQSVRGVPEHAHMFPKLYHHLKENNFETMPDRWGRHPASFYQNWVRQDLASDKKDWTVQ